jgi:hypothetical protein
MQPQINFIAILCAALLPLVMGFLYYHPSLFGNKWMAANNFVKANMTPPKPVMYLLAFFCSFLLAFFLWGWVTGGGGMEQSQVVDPIDGHSYVTFGHGVFHGVAFSLMVLLPVFITMKIFEARKWSWAWINIGYWSLTTILMCGLLSAWR